MVCVTVSLTWWPSSVSTSFFILKMCLEGTGLVHCIMECLSPSVSSPLILLWLGQCIPSHTASPTPPLFFPTPLLRPFSEKGSLLFFPIYRVKQCPSKYVYMIYLLFIFWLCCRACRILVPQPGIEPGPSAMKAWSPNHWTSREFPLWLSKHKMGYSWQYSK